MSCDESHEPNKPEQSRTLFGQIRICSAISAGNHRTCPNFTKYLPNKPEQSRMDATTTRNVVPPQRFSSPPTPVPSVSLLNGDGERNGACSALGKNAEELLGLWRTFQIEVVLTDNALGIARLQRGLAD